MSATTAEAADIREILRLLPHRYPFLMIDRIVDIQGEEHGIGIKNVSINEPQFLGHFPDNPVMPGVLLIEGMAQTAGVLCLRRMEVQTQQRSKLFFSPSTKRSFASPPCRAIPSNITSTRSRTAATCGGIVPRRRSVTR